MNSFFTLTLLVCLAVKVRPAQQLNFDVASVKAVKLAAHPTFGNRGGPGTADPGRIHLCCVGMFSFLMRAYDVEVDQIVGPPWIMENMGPNLYQVDATMPPDTTKDKFQAMMRNLLVERFGLEVHRELRDFPAYELVVGKDGPKLKESRVDADVTNSEVTNMEKLAMQKGLADGMAVLPAGPQMLTTLGRGMVRLQMQEKTVGDLVKGMGRLIAYSSGENPTDFASRKARVVDQTGLTDKYDFTLEFSCEGCAGIGTNLTMANGVISPSAPTDTVGSGLPNIFVALEKQLGLKLVKAKDIHLEVVVVDRVEKVPTAN